MWIADQWQDYELLDCGGGEKLERWGSWLLVRPDPQVIWPAQDPSMWDAAQAHYYRSERGGGEWRFREQLPERWQIAYGDLKFHVRPTGFKHTGLFPEQATNWDWFSSLIHSAQRPVKVLNLFAYTGGATLSAAAAGAAAAGAANCTTDCIVALMPFQRISIVSGTSCGITAFTAGCWMPSGKTTWPASCWNG
mgnify:CR=1 FL=1